ncbi:N-substituted formamide deformylase precursor [Pseudovibrio sp. Ad46]|uniref:amidohydrolase n=1 Tax=Pseudovibrio sp. Ad46 TaxID=989432 RepID=UPI0007AE7E13|nr:amidohydrolase [Pseudovibrio sp. Ad46]KZK88458.1 N-substituted formamide deformylase precursor [Pseudovibrio sp. Ad46]
MRWIAGLVIIIVGATAGYYWYSLPPTYPGKYIVTADRVLTMDPDLPQVQAVLVDDNEIMAVGDVRELEGLADVEIIRLKGTLIPGLIEPHTHPIAAALLGSATDISAFKYDNRMQIMQALQDSADEFSVTPWVLAYGWDPIAIRDLSPPTLAELDAISPDKPMLVLTQMMHEAYANTAALKEAGVDPRRGPMLRELEEINRVVSAIPTPSDEAVELLVRKTYTDYAKAGYTTIGVTGAVGRHPNPVGLLQRVGLEDNPPVRTYVYLTEDQLPNWRFGGDDRFTILGAKFWLDGSPFTGGAATHEPYEDSELVLERLGLSTGHRGDLSMSDTDLLEKLRDVHKRSGQVAMHAQGERAIDQALMAIAAIQAEDPRDDIEHRLEHNALITNEQIQRAADLGVSLGFFVDHISHYGDQLESLFGKERLDRYMPVRDAKDAGAVITFHGDHPATPMNPMGTVETAMSRTSTSGNTVVGVDQAVTLEEALQAMTVNAARQLGQEDTLGMIAVGMKADFTLLNGNPQVMMPQGLRLIRPAMTIRNGQPVDTRFVSWFDPELAIKAIWKMMMGDDSEPTST